MIDLHANLRLKEILAERHRFPVGVELVSTRGTMSQRQTLKAREFAEALTHSPRVDWVSITDNAGGNPQLAPIALGTPILYAGKEVIIHLTCKDLNRYALESQLWLLASQGFHNILALTGDYPIESFEGRAKPVFDLDSVSLLTMIEKMNRGLEITSGQAQVTTRLDSTHFYAGAVTNNFKCRENTLLPQYYKLAKKLAAGARFVINQIGFDSRKSHELLEYLRLRGLAGTPVIGNVYVLSPFVARLFNEMKIPGVTLTDELNALCQRQRQSPDKGRKFFREFAAKQLAVCRGLGYAAGYIGGVHSYREIEEILDIEKSFSPDDWKTFAREISFSRPNEFFLFDRDERTGLSQPRRLNPAWEKSLRQRRATKNVTWTYRLSKHFHSLMFTKGRGLAPYGEKICRRSAAPGQMPPCLRLIERAAKAVLYSCQDCGDCSLKETAFLCPESQCAKNQRNGPCGGTRNGKCEVFEFDCIWSRAYDRAKYEGRSEHLLDHAPVVQNQGLRGTSSWANFWLGKDHSADNNNKPKKKHD
ncbi:MAG: methylenetetrahydrofolate reductase C-terminal domain-containing protein [Verrucomicrobiales bacterium]|jgi:methylenetetrahydrofolate reductase (NADPH)|nr:methylenetetrahydrofolate reductase C-terminal domain-containing protein [Verrucomicrobiales bacterium]